MKEKLNYMPKIISNLKTINIHTQVNAIRQLNNDYVLIGKFRTPIFGHIDILLQLKFNNF